MACGPSGEATQRGSQEAGCGDGGFPSAAVGSVNHAAGVSQVKEWNTTQACNDVWVVDATVHFATRACNDELVADTTVHFATQACNDEWVVDTTVHFTVHWKVQNRLDFLSGVVDFVNTVKGVENDIFYYGFALGAGTRFKAAVCWEGYQSAKAFMYHLKNCAAAPIENIVGRGAAQIVCIEAVGPRKEVQWLQDELQDSFSIRTFVTDGFDDEAAMFRPSRYHSTKFFSDDPTLSVMIFWDAVDDRALDRCVRSIHSSCKANPAVKRFSISTSLLGGDEAEGRMLCFVCYSCERGFLSHWRGCEGFRALLESRGVIRRVLVHGQSTAMELLRSHQSLVKLDVRCWSALHGSFYCPKRFDPWISVSGDFHRKASEPGGLRPPTPWDGAARPGPERCIISKARLQGVAARARELFGEEYGEKQMYHVNEHIIRPDCERHGMPYALIPDAPGALCPHGAPFVFVTHGWGENFSTFVESVLAAVDRIEREDGVAELNLWICAFALFQSADDVAISTQLGEDPLDAPFTKALRRADYYLLVRNTEVDIFSRIWCCWEVYCATRLGRKFRIAGPNPFKSSHAQKEDIALAGASDLEDKRKILCRIFKDDGLYQHMNFLVALMKQV